MTGANEHPVGLFGPLRAILSSGLGLVQNRLELFSVELQEEKLRFFRLIISAAALAALGTGALAMVTFTLIIAFWETARLPVMVGLSSIYVLGTAVLYRRVDAALRHGVKPFSATVDEIKKDRSCLETRS